MRNSRTLSTLFVAASNFCTVFTSIGIAALLSRFLNKEEYATYRQTLLCFQTIEPILSLGLPIGILYFAARKENALTSTISKSLILLSIAGLTFALLTFGGGKTLVAYSFNNPKLNETLVIFSFYPTLYLITNFLKSVLIAQKKPEFSALFSFIESSLRIASITVVIIYFTRTAYTSIIGTLSAGLASALIALFFFLRFRPAKSQTKETFSYQDILRHSIPISIGVAIETISKNIDKIIVSTKSTPEIFAIFVNGAVEIPLIGIITGSTAAILTPEITKLFQNKDKKKAARLFKSGANKCSILLIPIGGFLYLFADELMTFLYGMNFIESSIYFKVYLTTTPLRVLIYSTLFQAAGKTAIILRRAIASLTINLVLSLFLTEFLGPMGAVVGTVLTIAFFATPYCLYKCTQIYECHLFDLVPVKTISLITLFTTIAVLTPHFLPLNDTKTFNTASIIKVISYTLPYLCLTYFFRKHITETSS